MMSTLKEKLKKQLVGWGKWLGIEVMDREQSMAYLANHLVATYPADQITLPAVDDLADPDKRLFERTEATTEPSHVWHYRVDRKRATLLRCGALLHAGRVLGLDWLGGRRLLEHITNRQRRVTHEVDTLIAPWSHYVDGIQFGGYYDYMISIAAKLCRLKETMSADAFSRTAVAYPLFNTAYERELLALIGVGPDRVFDSRLNSFRFDTCVLGNSGSWFYPNMSDLMALKRTVEGQFPAPPPTGNRIYISRSGRRRVLNETELMTLLSRYNIEFIADIPRTVAEQVSIYRNASFIIGPHGASFTNILWCQPGAHLVELFAPNYTPDFFLYMARRLGLRYSGYYHGPESTTKFSGLEDDIVVSIPDLERSLNALFVAESSI